jgi:hypothetical protein
MKRSALAVLAASLILEGFGAGGLLGRTATAAPFAPPQRFSISGQAGLGGAAMGEVNDDIERANAFLSTRNWKTVDEIETAFVFRGDIRANVAGPWLVTLGISRFTSSTGVDFDQVIDVKPSAVVFRATLSYQLPFWLGDNLRFAVGGGLDYASSAKMEITHVHRNVEAGTRRLESLRYEGSGVGGHGLLEAELLVGESAAIVGDVGWRQLVVAPDSYHWKIDRVAGGVPDQDEDGVPNGDDLSDLSFLRHGFLPNELVNSPGDIRSLQPMKPELDFSGVHGNVGLRFYIF